MSVTHTFCVDITKKHDLDLSMHHRLLTMDLMVELQTKVFIPTKQAEFELVVGNGKSEKYMGMISGV